MVHASNGDALKKKKKHSNLILFCFDKKTYHVVYVRLSVDNREQKESFFQLHHQFVESLKKIKIMRKKKFIQTYFLLQRVHVCALDRVVLVDVVCNRLMAIMAFCF